MKQYVNRHKLNFFSLILALIFMSLPHVQALENSVQSSTHKVMVRMTKLKDGRFHLTPLSFVHDKEDSLDKDIVKAYFEADPHHINDDNLNQYLKENEKNASLHELTVEIQKDSQGKTELRIVKDEPQSKDHPHNKHVASLFGNAGGLVNTTTHIGTLIKDGHNPPYLPQHQRLSFSSMMMVN